MRHIILDIETIADPAALACMDPVKADARLKDPVKIEADLAEKTLNRESELALHPDTCLIVALGYYVVGQSGDPCCGVVSNPLEEREHLKQFRDLYIEDKRGDTRIVTFYGMNFDLPVLMSRAMYLDLDFPDLNIDKFSERSHARFDVWWRLSRKGAVKAKSLKFYAQRLGFTTLDRVAGSEVAQLVKDGKWSDVEAHCLSDVGLTHAIANRLGMLKTYGA